MSDYVEIEFGRELIEAATKGFVEEGPRHWIVVDARFGEDDERFVHMIEAYDVVTAVAKVTTIYASKRTPVPISDLEISAYVDNGLKLPPVCQECGHQGPSVKILDEKLG